MKAEGLAPFIVPAAVLGGVLLLARRASAAATPGPQGTPAGGIGGLLGGLVGGGDFGGIVGTGAGEAKPPPSQLTGNVLDDLRARLVAPGDGGTVQRAAFASTVRLEVEVSNASNMRWFGALRLEVDEDYLLSDEHGNMIVDVELPAREARRIKIDYRLQASAILRNPNLYVQLFLGGRHQPNPAREGGAYLVRVA